MLTGHGLKDPQTALEQAGSVVPCEARSTPSSARCSDEPRRRVVRVPACSANLGPGFDAFAAALSLHMELEVEETGSFAVETDLRIADATAATSPSAASSGCTRADGFTFRIRSDIPLSGGLGTSAAAYVAGLMAADHLFELDADAADARDRARGPSRQRRRRAARRVRDLRRRRGDAVRRRPPGWRPCSSCRTSRSAPSEARAALPAEVPMADAIYNVGHASLLTLGLAQRRLGPRRPRAGATASTSPTARTCTRARRSSSSARASSARSARRSPAPARPSSSGAISSRRRGVDAALRREADGWADVMRAPFEPMGADVREL